MLIEQNCTPKGIALKWFLFTEICFGFVFVFKSMQYNSNDVCSPEQHCLYAWWPLQTPEDIYNSLLIFNYIQKIVLFTNNLASDASFAMRQSHNFSFILKENLQKSAFVQNVKWNLSSGSRLTAHHLAFFSLQWKR